jgi:hypothetical protein
VAADRLAPAEALENRWMESGILEQSEGHGEAMSLPGFGRRVGLELGTEPRAQFL